MNDECYKRFRKLHKEHIQCLYQTTDKGRTLYFLIKGSTGNSYKVTIQKTGKIYCSCPDSKTNAKAQECLCKHCLFVVFNVLGLFKDVHHTFFTRSFFTPDEVQSIHKIFAAMPKRNLVSTLQKK